MWDPNVGSLGACVPRSDAPTPPAPGNTTEQPTFEPPLELCESHISASDCTSAGCTWDAQLQICQGNSLENPPQDCAMQGDEGGCNSTAGCSWNSEGFYCQQVPEMEAILIPAFLLAGAGLVRHQRRKALKVKGKQRDNI